jgi:phage-related protein (TIGR01555 family)
MKRHHKDRAPASVTPLPKRPWMSQIGELGMVLAQAQADGLIPRRVFQAPTLPPGVLPKGAKFALDNAPMYQYLNQQPGYCGLAFPGYPYLSELAQRAEYRSPTETTAKEMTREWGHFTGASESEQKELTDAFQEFNVQACFRQMALHDGFFGRGGLFINIKGQDSDQRRKLPLVVDDNGATIKKGQLVGFKPIEPMWTTPYAYNSNNPTAPDFYAPTAWYIMGKQTHASRVLTFVSRPVPDILKPAYNFGGMSLSQLVEPYVVRWLKTVDSVNRLISNFSITALATNISSTLEDGGGADDLIRRAQLFNLLRDNRGLFLVDKDTEELVQKNTPLSGLSELQAQAQEHMAAPTHIPLVKLTGVTPAGLNANSDGEIKVWYDWIGSEQQDNYTPNLTTVLKIVQLHLWGKVNPKIGFEWAPLDSPTDKELAEMRKSDGDRDGGYVTNGIVTADEVRTRLRNDKNSGYTFLKGDAPPSPLEQEHELGEKSADADHERGEESAAAAHKRQKELDKAGPKK